MVNKFAQENEIHSSLVYSFFTWYQEHLFQKNYHGAFKEFYPVYQEALNKLNPINWNEENIKAVSEKIKAVFEIN